MIQNPVKARSVNLVNFREVIYFSKVPSIEDFLLHLLSLLIDGHNKQETLYSYPAIIKIAMLGCCQYEVFLICTPVNHLFRQHKNEIKNIWNVT